MNIPSRERWAALWNAAGCCGDPAVWFNRLEQFYGESHRAYHNFHHIGDCLREFDAAHSLLNNPTAVEMAIWFHDVIYNPRATDNEEQSAGVAKQCLVKAGAGNEVVAAVDAMILATKTHTARDQDSSVLLDIDLSILGATPERFLRYENQIRQEYDWVPEDVFRAKRSEILEKFLGRDRIYTTDLFFKRYEASARSNLKQSIAILRA